jgi:uncharacterized membrane protein YoaK (UPF0700 family)
VRSVERDVRLLMLAACAGCADGWSYFGLGHAFVANMTGNTVLLGLAVFQDHGDLLHPAISLACYGAGAVLGSFLTRNVRPGTYWSKTISWTLMLEGLLLAGAQAAWITQHANGWPNLHLLLGIVALAIGIQSGAMVQLQIPGIVTTYITGTWTTMLTGLVRLPRQKREQAPPQYLQFEQRLLLQAAVLSVYFLSAMLTGWLFRRLPLAVGVVPAAAVLLVALHGVLRADS